MPESIEDYANETRNLVENFDSSGFFGTWQGMALIAAVVLLILIWIFRRVSKARRRRKPVVLHPLLRKYGGDYGEADPEFQTKRALAAAEILATSTTPRIAGYRIIEQVDAVSVDGFHRPEEALVGLKAAAAMKGANAIVNIQRNRDQKGRYEMTGDAMIAEKISTRSTSGDAEPS